MKNFIFALSLSLTSLPLLAHTGIWKFKVYLDEQAIGQHMFLVEKQDQKQRVHSEASYDVRFLFFTAYRYRHTSEELWMNKCLSSIIARTDANGDKQFVSGSVGSNKLRLTTSSGEASLPACVMTFAYWDPAILTATRLLNSQTGEYVPVDVEFVANTVTDVNGLKIPSRHYRLNLPKTSIDIWYSQENQRWIGLSSVLENGSTLSYRLQTSGAML